MIFFSQTVLSLDSSLGNAEYYTIANDEEESSNTLYSQQQKPAQYSGNIIDGDSTGNILTGTENFDVISGFAGDDFLYGMGGADALSGGLGNDVLNGGDGPSISSSQGFVYRLYLATLDREADANGLNAWVNVLETGAATNASVAAGFVNSIEFQNTYGALDDAAFIELLYNNVLNRNSDPGGLQGWLSALNNGVSRAEVVVGFANSAEFIGNTEYRALSYFSNLVEGHLGAVYRAYGAVLNRAPDPAGFQGWLGVLDSGEATLQQVIDGFTGSQEFINTYGTLTDTEFVGLLYNNVLGRVPDQAGLQGWLNQLDSGASRAQVVLGFSQSAEFIQNSQPAFETFIQNVLSDQADTLIGGAGDDILYGGRGADTFVFDSAENGNDIVYFLDEFDSLQFTNFGYSTLADFRAHLSQSGSSTLFSDQGVTVLFHNTLLAKVEAAFAIPQDPTGTDNDDTLIGNGADNVIDGGAGNDVITGTGGNDIIAGGSGDDFLSGGSGDDILTGGSGEDVFVFNPNDTGSDTVTDLEPGDTIDLSAFGYTTTNEAMTYFTQVGDDIIFSDGNVTITFENTTLQNIENAINLPEIINGDVGDNILSGSDKDSTINGSGGHDIINGNGGNDTLNGGDGRDVLNGGEGDNTFTGGFGDDTFVFNVTFTGSNVVTDLTTGDVVQLLGFGYGATSDAETHMTQVNSDVVFSDQGVVITFLNSTVSNVVAALDLPNVVNGNGADNDLTGTSGFDIINGFDGNDTLRGLDDNDILNGDNGDDTLFGDGGSDELFGGAGNDTLYIDLSDSYYGGSGTDIVIVVDPNAGSLSIDLAARSVEEVFASNFGDTLDGSLASTGVTLHGLFGDDILTGSGFADLINGDEGSDVINAGDGDDTVNGGSGLDVIYGDAGSDTLDGGSDDDTVYGGQGNDVLLGGNGNDTLEGGDGFDFLDGGEESDSLFGGAGGDVLVGGFGADILNGGEGTDVFAFNIGDSLIGFEDIIEDMTAGERLALGTHTFIGENDFSATGAFEVRYVAGNSTFVQLDRNGDGIADESIRVEGEFDFTSDGQELTAIISIPGEDDGWVF